MTEYRRLTNAAVAAEIATAAMASHHPLPHEASRASGSHTSAGAASALEAGTYSPFRCSASRLARRGRKPGSGETFRPLPGMKSSRLPNVKLHTTGAMVVAPSTSGTVRHMEDALIGSTDEFDDMDPRMWVQFGYDKTFADLAEGSLRQEGIPTKLQHHSHSWREAPPQLPTSIWRASHAAFSASLTLWLTG